jgi:hypothetical protein
MHDTCICTCTHITVQHTLHTYTCNLVHNTDVMYVCISMPHCTVCILQCTHASHTWYTTTLQLCMHTNSTHWIVDTLVHLSTKHEAEQHQTTYIPTHEAIVVY